MWYYHLSWWYHDMETLFALLALCEEKHQWLVASPHKGPVMWSFYIFFFCQSAQANEQTVELLMIRGTTSLMWHHYNILYIDSCMFSFPVSEEITAAFRRFGPLVVDWPHKAESKSYFPPKGRTHFTYSQSPHNLTSLRGVARLKWCGWKITQIFTVKSLI